MRVCWAVLQTVAHGNSVGYTRAGWGLRAGLEQAGAVLDLDAELAVHFCYPRSFQPLPGKLNVLFTMYEMPELPRAFGEKVPLADAVVVPCHFNVPLLRPLTDKPIFVSPLGFDEEVFAYQRRPPRRCFRWLYLGAQNQRKGYTTLMDAWKRSGFFEYLKPGERAHRHELYVKTTPMDGKPAGITHIGNMTIDERILSDLEILQLYTEADAFCFPTTCEGWGLTLLEAMGTGLPCVAPLHTSLTEFADPTVVRPILWKPVQYDCAEDLGSGKVGEHSWKGTVCEADVESVIAAMHWIERDRLRAHRLGRRAHERAQQFTWKKAGEKLLAVCRRIAREDA